MNGKRLSFLRSGLLLCSLFVLGLTTDSYAVITSNCVSSCQVRSSGTINLPQTVNGQTDYVYDMIRFYYGETYLVSGWHVGVWSNGVLVGHTPTQISWDNTKGLYNCADHVDYAAHAGTECIYYVQLHGGQCDVASSAPSIEVGAWSNQTFNAGLVLTNGGLSFTTNAVSGFQWSGSNWVWRSDFSDLTNGLRRTSLVYGNSGDWAVSQVATGYHFDTEGMLRIDYGPAIWNTNAPGAAIAAKYGLQYGSLSAAEQAMWDNCAGPLQPAVTGSAWENFSDWEAGRFVQLTTNSDGSVSFSANIYGTNGVTALAPGDTVDNALRDLQSIIDATNLRLTNQVVDVDTNLFGSVAANVTTLTGAVDSRLQTGFFGSTPLQWPTVGRVASLSMGSQQIFGKTFVIAVDLDQTFGVALPAGRIVLVFAEAVGFVVCGMRIIRGGVA